MKRIKLEITFALGTIPEIQSYYFDWLGGYNKGNINRIKVSKYLLGDLKKKKTIKTKS